MKQVKMIAIDMDGTLLNNQKEMPSDFFCVMHQLQAQGIRFVIASGRQYATLAAMFQGHDDELIYICENGAAIFQHGEPLFIDETDTEMMKQIILDLRIFGDVNPVICGSAGAYIEAGSTEVIKNVEQYYHSYEIVDDLMAIIDQQKICKMSILDLKDAEHHVYPHMQPYEKYFRILLSGYEWVDVMNHGINKGQAYEILMKRFGLQAEECMAFGDYLNDMELLQSCAFSYAMANAHPDILAIANYMAPSNEEAGVVKVLSSMI